MLPFPGADLIQAIPEQLRQPVLVSIPSWTLVLLSSLDSPSIRSLLGLRGMVSAVLTHAPEESLAEHPDRIGFWNLNTEVLTPPRELAPAALFIGRPAEVRNPLRAAFHAHGCRDIHIMDPVTGCWTRQPTRAGAMPTANRCSTAWARLLGPLRSWRSRPCPEPIQAPALALPEETVAAEIERFVRRFPTPLLPAHRFRAGRVEHFIGTLGGGGGEQQLVNTLKGKLGSRVDSERSPNVGHFTDGQISKDIK